jgi:steroid 5-alpha reductase family enzyme
MELLIALAISMGINVVMFIPAYLFKTDKLTDISYAVTFVVVVWSLVLLVGATWLSMVLAMMVTVWAIRLGSYLLIRIQRMGRDKRFDKMRSDFIKFAGFWLLQGFTVWMVLIPSTMFISNRVVSVSVWAGVGVFVWVIGLIVETVADWQLFRFVNNPINKGKWIESGLWRYSRHPNYFGEITLWVGVYLYVVSGLIGSQIFWGLLGPLYIAGLMIFVSGIPILERTADKRWGSKVGYQEYKRRTSVLIPLPLKK